MPSLIQDGNAVLWQLNDLIILDYSDDGEDFG